MCPGLPPVPITTCNPVSTEAAALDEELMLLELLDAVMELELDVDDEVMLELDEELVLKLELVLELELELETLEVEELLESELELELPTELDEFDTAVPPPLHAEMNVA